MSPAESREPAMRWCARHSMTANVLLSRITRFSKLKRWGIDVAKRRGSKRAKVALARKIGIILHRMWIDGTTYIATSASAVDGRAIIHTDPTIEPKDEETAVDVSKA